MQEHELAGLLGPAYEETTQEQRERVHAAAEILDRLYDPNDDLSASALTGALMVILGDDDLSNAAHAWHTARAAEAKAHAHLRGAIISTPGSERDLAARAGVSRETVRKALGK